MLALLVLLCIFHVTCEFCTQVSEIWAMRLAGHTGIVLDVSSNARRDHRVCAFWANTDLVAVFLVPLTVNKVRLWGSVQ